MIPRTRRPIRTAAPVPAQIVFRSETLMARAYLGRGSSILFVVFDPMGDRLSLDRPAFGEGFFAAYGYDVVHILSARNGWYQDPDLPAALAAVRILAAPYERVVTYGSSMGGYGALRFSAAVGAHAAIAISPQYSVLPATMPSEARWAILQRRTRWLHERHGDRLPMVGQAFVFFDDRGPDGTHAAAILRDLPHAAMLPLSHAGHPVGTALKETGLLPSVVIEAAHGRLDPAAAIAALRRQRHQSAQYVFTLARRQPLWRMRLKTALAMRAVAIDPDNRSYLSYVGLVLECRGQNARSLAFHGQATRLPGFGLGELRQGRALWRMGARSEARAAVERAMELLLPDGSPVEICVLMRAIGGEAGGAVTLLARHPLLADHPTLRRLVRRLGASALMHTGIARATLRLVALSCVRFTVIHPRRIGRELADADSD